MRIVVTGTKGQLAQSLLACATADISLIAVGRLSLDFERLQSIAPALAAADPDVIVNAAAYTAVDQAETEEARAFRINATAAGAVAAAAKKLGVPVIHLSTDYVFDGSAAAPYRETDATSPINAYGRSKLAGEANVANAHADHVILRTSWVYSPFGQNFVKTMLRLGETRDTISVVADQHGSPTSAQDIAHAIVTIAKRLNGTPGDASLRGLFHIAGSGETTWAEFAQAIFNDAASRGRNRVNVVPITAAEYPTAAARPKNSRLNCDKLAQVYDLRLPDWRTSARACVAQLLDGAAGQ
jgi:dTDP-4-dehydrorhamnose reductase